MNPSISGKMHRSTCSLAFCNPRIKKCHGSREQFVSTADKFFPLFAGVEGVVVSCFINNSPHKSYLICGLGQASCCFIGKRDKGDKSFSLPNVNYQKSWGEAQYSICDGIDQGESSHFINYKLQFSSDIRDIQQDAGSVQLRPCHFLSISPSRFARCEPNCANKSSDSPKCTRPCAFIARQQCRPNPNRVSKKYEKSGNKYKCNYVTGVLVSEFPHELPYQKEMLA